MSRFDTERAFRHLHGIATEPHPCGSVANDEVRDYLVEQLTSMGLDVEVQDTVGMGHSVPTPYGPRYLGAGRVRNIVARLEGTERGAVALMSHYDSVAQGPGANDAGVPVCAILEAVRVLTEDPPRRDVLVVLTDGEEAGLLGARAFFAEHPLARTIDVVLNFEARGDRGPVLMFETSPGSRPLIRKLAGTRLPVVASSLFDEVYQRMYNSTDFAVSKEHGVPGLNFAHIGGFVHYHGPLDHIGNVDRRVLRQHGDLALGLVRALDEPGQRTGGNDVFFSVGNGTMVRYPVAAALPLAVCTALTSRPKFKGIGALAARLAAGALGATGLTWLLGKASPEFRRGGDFHDSGKVYGAVVALSAAGSLLGGAHRRRGAATRLPLAVASVVLAKMLPGASYLAVWPLLGGPVGGALVLAPLSRLLFQGLTPRMAGTSAIVLQLLGEQAAPVIGRLPRGIRRSLAVAAAATGAALAVRAVLPGEARPRPATLSYLLDADKGTALWLSSDAKPAEWTRDALGDHPVSARLPEYFPGWKRELLHAPAPVLDLPAPVVRVVAEQPIGHHRRVSLEIRSPRGARQMSISVPDGGVLRWAVDGHAVTAEQAKTGAPGEVWDLWLHAVPEQGFRLELDVATTPVRMRVADRSDGLPASGPQPDENGIAPAIDVETWGNATFALVRLEI